MKGAGEVAQTYQTPPQTPLTSVSGYLTHHPLSLTHTQNNKEK